jgi:hypothetical protein
MGAGKSNGDHQGKIELVKSMSVTPPTTITRIPVYTTTRIMPNFQPARCRHRLYSHSGNMALSHKRLPFFCVDASMLPKRGSLITEPIYLSHEEGCRFMVAVSAAHRGWLNPRKSTMASHNGVGTKVV